MDYSRLRRTLRNWLGHRWCVPLAGLLALVLCLPSIGNGLTGEDHIQQALVGGDTTLPWPETAAYDLYTFAPDEQYQERAERLGLLPWWSSPTLRSAFLRPLSSLSLFLDYRLWPDKPWLMHVHSLLWMAVLLVVVALCYQRFLVPPWLAALAAVLFFLDDAHGVPVGWLANRNALITAVLALVTLLFHDSWRRGWRGGLVGGPLALALAFAAGEMALAALAYLLAYALFLDRGRLLWRLASLVPYGLVFAGWALVYLLGGYGATGNDMYVSPCGQPWAFVLASFDRLPLLAFSQFGLPRSQISGFLPPLALLVYRVLSWLWLAVVGIGLAPLLRRDPVARFWALGAVLSLLPMAAAPLHDRLLLMVGVGAMGLVAQLIGHYLLPARVASAQPHWGRGPRFLAGAFVVLHLVLSPLLLPAAAREMGRWGRLATNAASTWPQGPALAHQHLVMVNAPDYSMGELLYVIRRNQRLAVPAQVTALVHTTRSLELHRVDQQTVVVTVTGGHFDSFVHTLFRRRRDLVPVGHRVERPGLVFEVTALTDDGQPAAVRVRFDRPLEHPALSWVTWHRLGYVPFPLPAPGQSVLLDIDETQIIQ